MGRRDLLAVGLEPVEHVREVRDATEARTGVVAGSSLAEDGRERSAVRHERVGHKKMGSRDRHRAVSVERSVAAHVDRGPLPLKWVTVSAAVCAIVTSARRTLSAAERGAPNVAAYRPICRIVCAFSSTITIPGRRSSAGSSDAVTRR